MQRHQALRVSQLGKDTLPTSAVWNAISRAAACASVSTKPGQTTVADAAQNLGQFLSRTLHLGVGSRSWTNSSSRERGDQQPDLGSAQCAAS